MGGVSGACELRVIEVIVKIPKTRGPVGGGGGGGGW